ncbi:hypothetical protein Dip510_001612 [Elusimicrobium posterum]|uniref:hypothetical protein n=1 Tax=Elusimicrobium posterum TaxID=3116653 RepID=UPI003C732B2B
MILQKEYANVEEAFNEAKHWLKSSMTAHLLNDKMEKVQGMLEAIKCIETFLSRVKK